MSTRLALSLHLSLALLVVACTPGASAPEDASARSDASAEIDAALPPPDVGNDAFIPGSETRSLTTGPYHVDPGVEQTFCVELDLGNDVPMMLRGVRTHITEGSHHLVVSRDTGSTVDPTPRVCPALTHGIGQAIFIAESRESALAYPSYAGLRMEAHQVIGLELHMINLDASTLDISGTVDFDLVPVSADLREVQILFTGPFSLDILPHQDTTETWTTAMTPGAEVIAMTTHTHQLGIDATLDVTPDASLPGTRVHESLNWSDPPLTTFDPPMVMGPTDLVRLTCVFRNPTDSHVYFGTDFSDEMCFFWAYYLDPL